MASTIDDAKLKELMKSALIEVLEERSDLFVNLLEDIIEDVGLSNAIREGLKSPRVSREEVMKALGPESRGQSSRATS